MGLSTFLASVYNYAYTPVVTDDEIRDYVSEAARAARAEAELTQAELADRLGIPRPRVAELEGGRGRWTDVKIVRWAEACRTSWREFLPPYPRTRRRR